MANEVVVLHRREWKVCLTPDAWAKILLLLEDNGWTPAEAMRTAYYVGATDVSKLDADSMADYGGRFLQVALNNPIKVYPVNADMGKLAEVVEFCKGGAFGIRWESPQRPHNSA